MSWSKWWGDQAVQGLWTMDRRVQSLDQALMCLCLLNAVSDHLTGPFYTWMKWGECWPLEIEMDKIRISVQLWLEELPAWDSEAISFLKDPKVAMRYKKEKFRRDSSHHFCPGVSDNAIFIFLCSERSLPPRSWNDPTTKEMFMLGPGFSAEFGWSSVTSARIPCGPALCLKKISNWGMEPCSKRGFLRISFLLSTWKLCLVRSRNRSCFYSLVFS